MRMKLFLAGILLALPVMAAAEVDCERLGDVDPISQHYVKKVMERADAGIAFAAEAKTNTDFFSFYLPWWARSIGGTFAHTINSRQQLTLREGDLSGTTACERFDQILLECTMNKVRTALDDELERGSFVAIMRLQSLMLFLHDRLYHLAQGGEDGSYADETWERQRMFDKDAPEKLEEPLCPFDSDYTPPSMTGYGCDAQVLGGISAHDLGFVDAERDGLASIEREIDRFREIIPLLESLSEDGQGSGNGYPTSVSGREHKRIIGCVEETGRCSDDDALVCGSDEFCASKGKGECERDEEKPTIPKRSIRGSFSYPADHLRLLTDFVEKRIEDGLSRTYPAGWALMSTLDPESDDAKKRAADDALLGTSRTSIRNFFFRSISGIQGRGEGTVFPEATDSQLEIAESLSDMRASIGELSRLASQKDGFRTFVVELAYFLRRTCAFRPCQKTLEQVIRIGLKDECFPYTNGEFLNDTEEDPRWKKCAKAACIQVEGVSLGGNCSQILP